MSGESVVSEQPYLAQRQINEHRDQEAVLERQLADPTTQHKKQVADQLRNVKTVLHEQSPPKLKGETLDKAVREEQELRGEIRDQMCSQEEMRKNPPGAVGKFLRGENSAPVKKKIGRWKNLRRAINWGSNDPDVANIEMMRPTSNTLNMDGAQIEGAGHVHGSFPSEQFKANYDGIDWQKEATELKARLDRLEGQAQASPQPTKSAGPPVTAPCGYPAKSKAGGLAHQRHCPECREATEAASADGESG